LEIETICIAVLRKQQAKGSDAIASAGREGGVKR
jgi:hypothetical protein